MEMGNMSLLKSYKLILTHEAEKQTMNEATFAG
jgi:hypothetical protein